MDLTTQNSNDTEERVRRLCAKAVNPFRRDIAEALGIEAVSIRPAAVWRGRPASRAGRLPHGARIGWPPASFRTRWPEAGPSRHNGLRSPGGEAI